MEDLSKSEYSTSKTAGFIDFNEEASKSHELTKSGRFLCKAFLGFIKTKQLMELSVKKKEDSCAYVMEMLWPQLKDDSENDNEVFDLRDLLQDRSVPQIFNSNMEELKIMFRDGRKFSDTQQSAFIRSFTVNHIFL